VKKKKHDTNGDRPEKGEKKVGKSLEKKREVQLKVNRRRTNVPSVREGNAVSGGRKVSEGTCWKKKKSAKRGPKN